MVKSILFSILHKTDDVKKTLFCLFIVFHISILLPAQIVQRPLNFIYPKVQAYSGIQHDVFSFYGNQAALAGADKFSAGIASERRFMLKELCQYNTAFVLPTVSGNLGFAAGYAGSQLYNESQVGLAYGRKMENVNVGVQFNYYNFKTQGYGNAPAVNVEGGAIFKVNEKLNAGIHIYNPTGSRIGKNDDERLPVIFSMGAGYDASGKFFIGSQVEKCEEQEVDLNACMQYVFAEKLFARTGVSSGTSCFFIGAGYVLKELRVDVTASVHQQLGLTPSLTLIYKQPGK